MNSSNFRPPAVAGQFYPEDPAELSSMIDGFLSAVDKQALAKIDAARVKALIVPHAGYQYSGPVAAYGYKLLAQLPADRHYQVIVIGVAHHVGIDRACADSHERWQTPLGEVRLTKQTIFPENAVPHDFEHSIEVQLPFLQKTLADFELLPLVANNDNPELLAQKLAKLINDDTLLIISSDLSHYQPYDEAVIVDQTTCQLILDRDADALAQLPASACGLNGILTLLDLAEKQNWTPRLLKYANSGDTSGDRGQVVGYATFVLLQN